MLVDRCGRSHDQLVFLSAQRGVAGRRPADDRNSIELDTGIDAARAQLEPFLEAHALYEVVWRA